MELLKECLESILPEARRYQIPILVADNFSDDGTRDMLAEFRVRYPLLSFNASTQRVPLWEGITQSVAMASSEFCWLFSDDDCIFGNPIERILEALSLNAGVVIVNATAKTKDLSVTIEDRRLQIEDDIIYAPGEHESFLTNTAFYLTFLGCVVVHRERFLENQAVHEKETYFRHLVSMLSYCHLFPIYIIAQPCISIRLQNAAWTSRRFEVLMIDWPRAIWSLPKRFSFNCKRSVVQQFRIGSIKEMIAARAFGMFNPSTYKDYIEGSHSVTFLKKKILKIVVKLPIRPMRLLFFFYLSIFRPRGYRVYIYDLVHT